MESLPLINSVGMALLSAVMTFLAAWFWYRKNKTDALYAQRQAASVIRDQRIADLEKQIAVIVATVAPLTLLFQQALVARLTHPHTVELDDLMKKLGPPCILTDAQRERMEYLLWERARTHDDEVDEIERHSAVLLPLVVKLVELIAAKDLKELAGDPLLHPASLLVAPEKD